jgi:hypothetical protein
MLLTNTQQVGPEQDGWVADVKTLGPTLSLLLE